jgi:LmbE family N-acetylglucosaminyl deacetylase
MDILVIAAHPDDEVLGMGGTIKKLSKQKNKIHLCIVSDGAAAVKDKKSLVAKRKAACLKSGKLLGISTFDFLMLPDMKLDDIPQLKINLQIEKLIKKYKPTTVYTTPYSDFHKDHQKIHECTLVATRPASSSVKNVLSYEIPGTVKTTYIPTIFEEISKELNDKISAFKFYTTEIKKYPHPRSIESIKNLAMHRGIESGLKNAEAFRLIRSIND